MVLCSCTPQILREHAGHAPGCRFHVAPSAPMPPPTDGDLSVLPVPPIEPGSERYPIARALALLVQARAHLRMRVEDAERYPTLDPTATGTATLEERELATEITRFLNVPVWDVPPAPSTDDLPLDSEDLRGAPPVPPHVPLEAFAGMPGTAASERLQSGPVMATPPPPAPSFRMPPPRAAWRPAYSNGCSHPAMRLQPNGHGFTCLDCATDFPAPPAAAAR